MRAIRWWRTAVAAVALAGLIAESALGASAAEAGPQARADAVSGRPGISCHDPLRAEATDPPRFASSETVGMVGSFGFPVSHKLIRISSRPAPPVGTPWYPSSPPGNGNGAPAQYYDGDPNGEFGTYDVTVSWAKKLKLCSLVLWFPNGSTTSIPVPASARRRHTLTISVGVDIAYYKNGELVALKLRARYANPADAKLVTPPQLR